MARLDVLCVGLVLGASACTILLGIESPTLVAADAGSADAGATVVDGGVPVTVSAEVTWVRLLAPGTPDAAPIPPDPEPDAGWLASRPFVEGGGMTTFLPEDFTDVVARAQLLDDATQPSVGGAVAPGQITFGAVPLVGGVYLRLTRGLETPELFELPSAAINLDRTRAGRPDRPTAGPSTVLQIRATGLAATGSFWRLVVMNVGDIERPDSSHFGEDLETDLPWAGEPLFSGEDFPVLVVYRQDAMDYVASWITPYGSVNMGPMTSGQANVLSGKFRRIALDRPITYDVDAPAFAAMIEETCPQGQAQTFAARVHTHPITTAHGPIFPLLLMREVPLDVEAPAAMVTRSHGNPFGWAEIVEGRLLVSCRFQLPTTGFDSGFASQSSSFVLSGTTADLTPLITPPRLLTLDGTDVRTAATLPLPATGGLELAWQAPRLGTPNRYVVEVLAVENDSGVTRLRLLGRITTTASRLKLPRELTQRGQTFAVSVRAELDGSTGLRQRSFPHGEATAFSSIVTVTE